MSGRIRELAGARLRALANGLGLSPLSVLRFALLAALDVAALAFAIGATIGGGEDRAAPKTEWRPPQALTPPQERAGLAGEELATLSRPIFWRSRRAPPPSRSSRKTDGRGQAMGAATGLTLGGIVKIGERARAFLVVPGASEGRWVEKGETVEGWTVEEIAAFAVTVSDGGQSSRLQLYAEASEKSSDKAPDKEAEQEPEQQPEQESEKEADKEPEK
ncbi:hypothetical protein [Methylosinus sp. Sm6]|uniref:hypothetical protein n=1 Tax=Methylosinus sp. Sm6 TaxID=2866948 RepID=UPI001C98F7D9|nr:hypothetical protein [Methylosinus sp. Sm6]MBY6242705.1 hypothetical protein [Methylosinus sp. Sm6]